MKKEINYKMRNINEKRFQNFGPSKICGRQPLKNFICYVLEYFIPYVTKINCSYRINLVIFKFQIKNLKVHIRNIKILFPYKVSSGEYLGQYKQGISNLGFHKDFQLRNISDAEKRHSACIFINQRLWHKQISVNLANFLKKPLLEHLPNF